MNVEVRFVRGKLNEYHGNLAIWEFGNKETMIFTHVTYHMWHMTCWISDVFILS